jgi:hypothetical protein
MLTIAMGILIAVVLLFGFGFIATASVVWFFTIPKNARCLPPPDKY